MNSIYLKTKLNHSGSSKPKRHRQEVSKDKVREDVEESEEGEDVCGVHPECKSDGAGEPGGDAAKQPRRQLNTKTIKTR